MNATVVLRLAGAPPAADVERALAVLQRRRPLLRVRLVEEGGRSCFAGPDVPAIPLRAAARDDDAAWTAVAEAELNQGIDTASGPLVRGVYLAAPAGGAAEIVLTFHHAVMDGTSALHLCRELLALVGAGGAGGPDAGAASAALPPPVEALFPPPFRGRRGSWRGTLYLLRQLWSDAVWTWRWRGRRPRPASGPRRCEVTSQALSAEATAALVRRSRRERVTLNSAVQAAAVLTVLEHLAPERGARPLPVRCLTFADLRRAVKPPVEAEVLGSYFAMLRVTVPAAASDDFWGVARRVNERVYAANRRGDKFLAALAGERMMRGLIRVGRLRMAELAVSYTGPASFAHAADAVAGVHAFVSSFELAPLYTAQVRIFGDRLWWDALTLAGDMDRATARRLTAAACARLERAALGGEA